MIGHVPWAQALAGLLPAGDAALGEFNPRLSAEHAQPCLRTLFPNPRAIAHELGSPDGCLAPARDLERACVPAVLHKVGPSEIQKNSPPSESFPGLAMRAFGHRALSCLGPWVSWPCNPTLAPWGSGGAPGVAVLVRPCALGEVGWEASVPSSTANPLRLHARLPVRAPPL